MEAGYERAGDFEGKFDEDFKDLKGFGPKALYELKNFLKFECKITIKKKPKPKTSAALNKYIVEKFIKPSLFKSYDPAIKDNCWKHNAAIAARLSKTKPEMAFWERFEIKFKLNTLTYFFKAGKADLDKEYKIFLNRNNHADVIKKIEKAECGEDKLGDDIVRDTSSRPKTIKDFLK